MTQYVAKTNTGIYPYGIVRKGDVLKQKHMDALGETGLSVLIANGVIGEVQEEAAASGTSSVSASAATEGLTGPASLETAHSAVSRALAVPKGEGFEEPEEVEPEEEDFEDGETLTDLEGLDELDGEAEGGTTSSVTADAATPSPEGEGKKPGSRKRTGGKKQ